MMNKNITYGHNKSIKKNAVLNGIRNICNLIFPLITIPYVSRVLSVESMGKYNFSQSIVSYFLLIAALGIDKYAVREGTKYRDNKKQFSQFASEVFTINIISTILAYLLLVLYLLYSKKGQEYSNCILVFSIQIIFTTIGIEWLYSIYEDYQYITIRSILFKAISLVLLFAFVRKPSDYMSYAAISVFAVVGSNFMNYIHAKKYCKLKLTFHFNANSAIKAILIIFATNIAIQIYVNSDVTMLGYLKNDNVVGIYSLSSKIYMMIKNLLSAVLIVTIPRFSYYLNLGKLDDYNKLLLKLINTLSLLILPTMILMLILSGNIVQVIGGNQYLQSATSLKILCIALVFSIFSMTFNQCILIPYRLEKIALYSSIISALLNIGLNFVLIPIIAENGAAITTVLAELIMMLLNGWFCREKLKSVFHSKLFLNNIKTVIIGCMALALVCYFTRSITGNPFLDLMISGILSLLTYAATQFLFGNIYIKKMMNNHTP